MKARTPMALTCASLLALYAASAAAQTPRDATVCKRLGGEALERCAGLTRRDRYKARVLARLERINHPPQAALELVPPTPGLPAPAGRISLDASGSADADGFVEHYTFQLFDAETGDVLSSGVRTRDPFATLTVLGGLPPQVRANVIVEDDLRATDNTDLAFASEAADTCSNAQIQCTVFASGQTDCDPIGGSFSTDEVLDAAQQCDASLTKDSPVLILAVGGNGGKGADFWPHDGGDGGSGGMAAMTTTLALMDETYGAPPTTTYCYGVGQNGSHGDTHSGAGGSSTILRTCQNVSPTKTTGVLLIAGGGGGGSSAGTSPIGAGAGGGKALSKSEGPCPPNCVSGSTASGAGGRGGANGGQGGGSGKGGTPTAGSQPTGAGYDGVGGHGGNTTDTPVPVWHPGNPLVADDYGAGGSQKETGGGSGGGGYGGGASGNVGQASLGGGGGGGSYAAQSFRKFALGSTTGARLEFVFNWSGFID